MVEATTLALSPLLPWAILGPLLGIAVVIVALGLIRRARGMAWRFIAVAVLAAALVNPSLVNEQREPIADVAVVVVDDSPSQSVGDRRARAAEALAEIEATLGEQPDLELRVVQSAGEGATIEETRLFEALGRAIADVPRGRLAGAILLTDGQVHDVPANLASLEGIGPIHSLLTGQQNEADRHLRIAQAPGFGVVGEVVEVTLLVEDSPEAASPFAQVTVQIDGGDGIPMQVPVGTPVPLQIPIEHAGPTVVELEVAQAQDELSLTNNRAAVVINGVRDRLRVLLVSGEPHPGERTWRNILKSDPGVDLVHFTILRPPEKQDGTPINELSLISFPIRELFELRLSEFDLIIFDRYRRRGVLPNVYLGNIARFVEEGGAFLEASGPQFASAFSLFDTPLGQILPGEPTGMMLEEGFQPALTELGQRHPVTAELEGAGGPDGSPAWGRWFRQIDVLETGGATVMTGAEGRPLLILERVGEGRVAQLTSDHIWLWSRGFEGGGPQAELLRRLAHWLMQEPELEENDLRATVTGTRVEVERRSLEEAAAEVEVTAPSGAVSSLALEETGPGRAEGNFAAREPGIFRLSDGEQLAWAVVGSADPPELADMRSIPDLLQPVADSTGGAIAWLVDGGLPELRRVAPDRAAEGRGWIGLRANGDYTVVGVNDVPLLPALLVMILAVGALLGAWHREGR